MDKSKIKQVSDSIELMSISLNESEIKTLKDLGPIPSIHSFKCWFTNSPDSIMVFEKEGKDDNKEIPDNIIRISYKAVVRLKINSEVSEGNDDLGVEAPNVEIIAIYHATFKITDPTILGDDDSIDEFAKYNVAYLIWPYWREYIASSCTRMGIESVHLPLYNTNLCA